MNIKIRIFFFPLVNLLYLHRERREPPAMLFSFVQQGNCSLKIQRVGSTRGIIMKPIFSKDRQKRRPTDRSTVRKPQYYNLTWLLLKQKWIKLRYS